MGIGWKAPWPPVVSADEDIPALTDPAATGRSGRQRPLGPDHGMSVAIVHSLIARTRQRLLESSVQRRVREDITEPSRSVFLQATTMST